MGFHLNSAEGDLGPREIKWLNQGSQARQWTTISWAHVQHKSIPLCFLQGHWKLQPLHKRSKDYYDFLAPFWGESKQVYLFAFIYTHSVAVWMVVPGLWNRMSEADLQLVYIQWSSFKINKNTWIYTGWGSGPSFMPNPWGPNSAFSYTRATPLKSADRFSFMQLFPFWT